MVSQERKKQSDLLLRQEKEANDQQMAQVNARRQELEDLTKSRRQDMVLAMIAETNKPASAFEPLFVKGEELVFQHYISQVPPRDPCNVLQTVVDWDVDSQVWTFVMGKDKNKTFRYFKPETTPADPKSARYAAFIEEHKDEFQASKDRAKNSAPQQGTSGAVASQDNGQEGAQPQGQGNQASEHPANYIQFSREKITELDREIERLERSKTLIIRAEFRREDMRREMSAVKLRTPEAYDRVWEKARAMVYHHHVTKVPPQEPSKAFEATLEWLVDKQVWMSIMRTDFQYEKPVIDMADARSEGYRLYVQEHMAEFQAAKDRANEQGPGSQ